MKKEAMSWQSFVFIFSKTKGDTPVQHSKTCSPQRAIASTSAQLNLQHSHKTCITLCSEVITEG